MTKTKTIAMLLVAIAAIGMTVTAIGTGIAHASQFGSCNQNVNGVSHLNGDHGQLATDTRQIICG